MDNTEDCSQLRRFDAGPTLPRVTDYPVHTVAIADLDLAGTPRLSGEDPEHTRALADVADRLPPITVHAATLRVIDGMHRVRAALLNGRIEIDAHVIDCDEATALVLAVHANVTHGLPLSADDRKSAAIRIMTSHPDWSDRTIAASAGLSDKTVSALRAGATANGPQSHSRLGRDGRLRPINSGARRREAAAMMIARPDAGLREIARATGLSPATVRDVRQRTGRGEDPVPARYRERPEPSDDDATRPSGPRPLHRAAPIRRADVVGDREELLARLMNDPSVRFSANGRYTLRWLYHYALDVESCSTLRSTVPDHWALAVAELARGCAQAWSELAERLETRSTESAG